MKHWGSSLKSVKISLNHHFKTKLQIALGHIATYHHLPLGLK